MQQVEASSLAENQPLEDPRSQDSHQRSRFSLGWTPRNTYLGLWLLANSWVRTKLWVHWIFFFFLRCGLWWGFTLKIKGRNIEDRREEYEVRRNMKHTEAGKKKSRKIRSELKFSEPKYWSAQARDHLLRRAL